MNPALEAILIFEAAVRAADAAEAVRRRLLVSPAELRTGRSYALVAAGKAAVLMARAAVEVLGVPPRGGLVAAPRGAAADVAGCVVQEADHPVPTADSIAAGRAALELAARLRPDDLLLVLVSGGASALLECPAPGVSLEEIVRRTESLLASGATIREVNAARARLSRIKRGGLARATQADVLCLVASDVTADDDPAVVGGGPAVPPPGEPAARRTRVDVVLTNEAAVRGAAAEAARRGRNASVLTRSLAGEAREAAADLVAQADDLLLSRRPVAPPAALVAGGETTVTLEAPRIRPPGARWAGPRPATPPRGSGGRCQEFALAAAIALDGRTGVAVLAAGTDGRDGPTDAAGAVVDGGTAAALRAAGIDPGLALARHDSHGALAAVGATLTARPTGTNVADLYLALVD